MVDVVMSEQPAAEDQPQDQQVDLQMQKQQAQLLEFNEYIHRCRDLFKEDPTMVSLP